MSINLFRCHLTSIKYKVERDERYLPYINDAVYIQRPCLYRVRSLALQPLSAGNSAEFSQADNSKTIQPREMNLTPLDSLGFCESIYVYLNPKTPMET